MPYSPDRASQTKHSRYRIHMCVGKAHPTLADRNASGPNTSRNYHFTLLLENSNRCRRVAVTPSPLSPPDDPQAVHRTGPGYSGIRVVLGTVPAKAYKGSIAVDPVQTVCPASPTGRMDICKARPSHRTPAALLIAHQAHENLMMSVRP